MRIAFAFSAFASWLATRLPCPPSAYYFTKEHIAPRSLFPPVVTEKPHNIIPLPAKLNHARGNRPYTAQWADGYMVYSCKACPTPGFCRGSAVLSSRGVHPPDIYKGVIARSVLKTLYEFPHLKDKLDKEVLDLETAIKWDSMFPMTKEEHAFYISNSSSE